MKQPLPNPMFYHIGRRVWRQFMTYHCCVWTLESDNYGDEVVTYYETN